MVVAGEAGAGRDLVRSWLVVLRLLGLVWLGYCGVSVGSEVGTETGSGSDTEAETETETEVDEGVHGTWEG